MNRFPYFLLAAAILLSAIACFSKSSASVSEADARKADYIYLEALKAKALGNDDATYELLESAHRLNPSDKEIGSMLANYLLPLSGGDSVKIAKAVEMIRQSYYADRSNYYEALRYGILSENLDDRDEALSVWRDLHSRYPEKIELTYKFADYLAAGGDSAGMMDAIAIYDSIEVIDGRSIPVTTKKIQIYYKLDDSAAIVSEVEKLLNSAPKSVEYNVFAGEILALMNRRDSALLHFDRACELDPSNGMANYSRAQFYNSIGDSVAYDREVFSALEHDNLDVETKLAILRSYIEKMFTDSAAMPRIDNLFDVLIDMHPHEPDIHSMFSSYLIARKDYVRAAEQAEFALDIDPADLDRWRLLMSLYFQIENWDKVESTVNRALRYYPEESELYIALATVKHHNKDYAQALKLYDTALSHADSTDLKSMSSIYTSMADTYYAMGDMDEAMIKYDLAISYDPENYVAMNNTAYYLACENKDLDKALNLITRSLKGDPESLNSLDTYAWVLFKMKDYAKAKEIIDALLNREKDSGSESSELFEHAGDIYFMNGLPDEALEFWKRALSLNPESELLQRKVKNKTYFYK